MAKAPSSADMANIVEVQAYENFVVGGYELAYYAMLATNGISSATLSVALAKNTRVTRFDVIVQAGRAQQTAVEKVAQVRAYSGGASDNKVVIDFGVPRTVSAINVPSGSNITAVAAWNGSAFGYSFFTTASPGTHAVFASEVRSERLLVTLSKAIPSGQLGQGIILELPEVPADLDIRINGAAPVWTNPGPVQPTAESALSAAYWNKDAKRIVSLADALNALLDDPLSDAVSAYEFTLTSKVPGVLNIVEATAAANKRSFSYINRISIDNDTSTILNFVEEGYIELPLPLSYSGSKNRQIEEVRLTALGNLPAQRTLPAIGPPWASTPDTPVLAELVLDADRAVCARLSGDSGLAELSGIRLPLATGGDGAEVSVVLWANKEAGSQEPSAVLDNGASAPVTLATATAASELWSDFTFSKPVPIDADNPPWVAVLVSRGTVTWTLASSPVVTTPITPDGALVEANVLRRGAPNGPWRALPPPFQSVALMQARGRLRMTGTGAKAAPVAPLLLRAVGTGTSLTEVTPSAKGVQVILAGTSVLSAGEFGPVLLVVSRAAGAVTLRDIDVLWHEL